MSVRDRLVNRAAHMVWLVKRPMTLGVRAALFDNRNRVFLIKHTYVSGWHMPGGGVEVAETVETALRREIEEEGNIELTDRAELFGVYHNTIATRRDHVVLYVCRQWKQQSDKIADAEIADSGLFALNALPDGTTPATRRRLKEIAGDAAIDEKW